MESQHFPGFTRWRQRDMGTDVKWSRSGINLSPECSRLPGVWCCSAVVVLLCVCRSCGGESCDRSRSKVCTADLLTS